MLSHKIVLLPLGYTIKRYYPTLVSFGKFLGLEMALLVLVGLESGDNLFDVIARIFLFYALYEIGYFLNDTVDVKGVRSRLSPDAICSFRKYLPFRVMLIICLFYFDFGGDIWAILALFAFFIFNKSSDYCLRILLLAVMAYSRFLCAIRLDPADLFSFIISPVGLAVSIFVFQKIIQYYFVKIHQIRTGYWKYFIISWALPLISCGFLLSNWVLFFSVFISIVYWILFFRKLNESA